MNGQTRLPARHRGDPFHRHRRHRHVGDRRGAAEPRLHRAGLGPEGVARSPSGWRRKGARVFIGQKAENLEGAHVVVISSAIKPGNPELDAARARNLPVVRRAEMLAELMRLKSNVAVAGTHGKTTTTSMVAALLDAGGMDPTVINGGVIHAYGSNARIGQGEWMVVEADESDGSFNKLPATVAIDHQHRPRASRPLRQLRGDQGGVRHLRLEHPVLRARGLLHRPSGGAGAGRADDRPAGRDLRLHAAGGRAGEEPATTRTAGRGSTSR